MNDYDELVKRLYDSDTVSCEWGDFCKAAEAADAIKALLRERDDLATRLGQAQARAFMARLAALEEAAALMEAHGAIMSSDTISVIKVQMSYFADAIRTLKEKQPKPAGKPSLPPRAMFK